MTDSQDSVGDETGAANDDSNWGPWLFYATLVITLAFFWWLLIESGGVSGQHG